MFNRSAAFRKKTILLTAITSILFLLSLASPVVTSSGTHHAPLATSPPVSATNYKGTIPSEHLQTLKAIQDSGRFYPAKTSQRLSSRPLQANLSLPKANYDQQLGLTFSQNFTNLSYNVTAIEQSDSYGYGPAYLLNGLSDKGYWYQVGLSWDWPFSAGGYTSGFNFVYEVFNSSGNSVFPQGGGGGLTAYSGPVNPGDSVLLNLYFSGGQVLMYSKDWNTGSTAYQNYNAAGASTFMGLPLNANSNGFFSGPMTEMYRVSPFYGQETKVSYTNPKSSLSTGTMWIEERNVVTNITLFAQASHLLSFSSPGLLQFLSSNGATIGADAFQFITGATSIFGITLSYAIQAGGVGYNPPTLNYYSNGTQHLSTLSQLPTTYYMDDGSSWSVNSLLQGSGAVERWTALQSSNGIASSSKIIVLIYDHQFQVTIAVNPPQAGTTQPSGANWFEAGSQIQIQGQASNPYIFAEWLASSFTFGNAKSSSTVAKISGPGTIEAKFSIFALSLPEYSGNITQGANTAFNITLTGIGVATTLSVLGLPDGATSTFAVNPALPSAAGVMVPFTISMPAATTPGMYNLTILANSSQGSDSAMYSLYVTKAVPLTFELSGASTPQAVLSYTFNGVNLFQNLSITPRTLQADYGSKWNVAPILPGSNSSLRWITNENTNGTATDSATVNLAYFQQYAVNFGIQIPDGSVPSRTPSINFTSFGSPSTIVVNKTGSVSWVDASSL
ncbi:MAG: hypothetical protein OK457_02635, partial [Thaumarchaeota archaeon]|nr:hypothetical protein [Nitrososphaerota archaeon]